jgi:bacterial/archaeal transporter family protein
LQLSTFALGGIPSGIAALSDSCNQLAVSGSRKKIGPNALACITIVGIALVYTPMAFLYAPEHPVPFWFWVVVAMRGILEVIGIEQYFSALQEDDVSLTAPLANLKPVFILALVAVLGLQAVTPLGALGVVAVIAGCWWLQRKPGAHWIASFKTKTSRKMMFASIIWAIGDTSLVFTLKVASVQYAVSMATWAFAVAILVNGLVRHREEIKQACTKQAAPYIAGAIATDAIAFYCMLLGYNYWNASYVASIRCTSAIFSTVVAALLFHEKIGKRILPILLMVAGGIAISFAV